VKDSSGFVHCHPVSQAESLAKHWETISKNIHTSYVVSRMESLRALLSPLIPRTRNEAASLLSELPKNSQSKWQACLTIEELRQALASTNMNSNPGEDSISYEMIKFRGDIFNKFLLNFYNYCWATGIFPQLWKSGIVIALPRQSDAINVNEFRPISLLLCVGKLFEKIISERLRFFMERSGIFNNSQFGFRTNRSTTEQLTRIVQFIHNGWEQGMDTIFVSFDVKKAFDSMWHDGLLFKLHQIGIRW